MRWDQLFEDLEAQLAAEHAAELAEQVADLTRAERATITLVDRLRGARGRPLGIDLVDGSRVQGIVRDAAAQWILLAEDRRQHLVATSGIVAVSGLGPYAVPAESERADRLGLGHVLRALMRDRVMLQVRTAGGVLGGRIARVGRDHLDLEPVALEPRGHGSTRTVPLSALLCVSEG